jgi:hypothetical protein
MDPATEIEQAIITLQWLSSEASVVSTRPGFLLRLAIAEEALQIVEPLVQLTPSCFFALQRL